jgi:hypothetical protein
MRPAWIGSLAVAAIGAVTAVAAVAAAAASGSFSLSLASPEGLILRGVEASAATHLGRKAVRLIEGRTPEGSGEAIAPARLWVDNAPQPALIVTDLKHGVTAGQVGLWIGDGTEAFFSSLKVRFEK